MTVKYEVYILTKHEAADFPHIAENYDDDDDDELPAGHDHDNDNMRWIFSPSIRLQTSHMSPTMDLDSISCLMIDPMMISRSFVQIITYLVQSIKPSYACPSTLYCVENFT